MSKTQQPLVIAYFNIRGKAQVPRLLCEYLSIPYSNKFYTPKEFMEEKKKNPNFAIPFVKCGKDQAVGPQEMCYYLLNKKNNVEMLGKTEEDKVKVKMYCWSIDSFASIIGTNSVEKPDAKELEKQWEKNLKLKLKKYEKACYKNGQWFLGYLTVIDFSIYELVRYMEWMYPGKMKVFESLCSIKAKFSILPEIKAYESSAESVKEMSPQNILGQISNLTPQQKKK